MSWHRSRRKMSALKTKFTISPFCSTHVDYFQRLPVNPRKFTTRQKPRMTSPPTILKTEHNIEPIAIKSTVRHRRGDWSELISVTLLLWRLCDPLFLDKKGESFPMSYFLCQSGTISKESAVFRKREVAQYLGPRGLQRAHPTGVDHMTAKRLKYLDCTWKVLSNNLSLRPVGVRLEEMFCIFEVEQNIVFQPLEGWSWLALLAFSFRLLCGIQV